MSLRIEKTEKLDIIGNLALNPEKVPDLLVESKKQDEFFIKAPSWDSPGDGVELLALQNEREYNKMLQLQEEMLTNAKHQNVINTNRIDELFKTLNHTRNRFIKANNFFKDCSDKKKSAESKLVDLKKVHAELKNSISSKKISIDVFEKFREVLQKTVNEYEPYDTILKDAVAESDMWVSVQDCMDKCDGLMMTHVEICEMKKEKLKEIEELRMQMVKLSHDAAQMVLVLKNQLSECEKSFDQAVSECFKWEKILASTKDCIIQNKLTKTRVLDEITIVYRLLCKRRGLSTNIKRVDVEKQMDFIRDEIKILQGVVNECLET